MNSNSFLLSFGLDPNDFSKADGPVQSGKELVYEVWEARADDIKCPKCGCAHCDVHHRYTSEANMRGDVIASEVCILHRIVYRCRSCGKTFTKPLHGIKPGNKVTYAERAAMLAELCSGLTFSYVAFKHTVSVTEVVKVFDAAYPSVAGKRLPKILCVDEFKFKTDAGKYACHLVDFDRSETVDIIISRQKAYIDEYFSAKSAEERARVKYVVTDMYDEYAAMARRWMPNATVVVDRFHVVKQLTEAVNSLRVAAMAKADGEPRLRQFMKSRWKCFLCRSKDIPNKTYTSKSTGETWHYDDMVEDCLAVDDDFREGYYSLQELLKLMEVKKTHAEALSDVEFMATKLKNCRSEKLKKTGETYAKWKNGIAMGLAKNELGAVLSNGKMEAHNDVAQTEIDAGYGYRSFDRFRRKFLLTRWKNPRKR